MLGATVFVVLLYFWAPVSAFSLVVLLTLSVHCVTDCFFEH